MKPFVTVPPKPFLRPPPPRYPNIRMSSSSSSSCPSSPPVHNWLRKKDKIVVIVGATGCGKSRLSVDLATRLGNSEIINSDKIQLYNGLDITTNKITVPERRGVPHHLLGSVDPFSGDFSSSDFRLEASLAISDIVSRRHLPIIAGGSNSRIYALLVDQFRPDCDVFDGSDPISTQLRYDCCFLWVDVSFPVLCQYLIERVDEMLDSGMFEELSGYHKSGLASVQPGLRKAIGVPEFEKYFNEYPPGCGRGEWDQVRARTYEEAVRLIKENTCELAKRQIWKIEKLKGAGWDLQRLDATATFKEVISGKKKRRKRRKKNRWMEVWEEEVLRPSMKIVKSFLEE